MDLKELSVPVEATGTAILKPTAVIANTISKEYLKISELKELCRIFETDLKEYETTNQMLISLNGERAKIKAEYKRRNKINITNSESLFQAKNELYKYKCELKSNYIAAEKALKFKKLKYRKIICSYKADWQKALKQFNSNSIVMQLHALEEENVHLEKILEKQDRLNSRTEKEIVELAEYIQHAFLKKIVEFSGAMIQYRKYKELELQKQNKELGLLKLTNNSPQNFEFTLFREAPPFTEKNSSGSESNDDVQCFSNEVIDVSIFDDLTVPSENLESQHLEEDCIYSTPQNREQLGDSLKDQEKDLESLNGLKNCEQTEDKKIKKYSNVMGGDSVRGAKATITNENESWYFRPQSVECSKQSLNEENNVEKSNSINIASEVHFQTAQENEEDVQRQMEYEESLSEGGSENQFNYQRDIYERHCRKTSSFSSDEFPNPAENTNAEAESPTKPGEEEGSNSSKPGDSEKHGFKSFAGFFTMGNDQNSPKPSIFKLF